MKFFILETKSNRFKNFITYTFISNFIYIVNPSGPKVMSFQRFDLHEATRTRINLVAAIFSAR